MIELRPFCVSGQIKGGSPERSSICENHQGRWRGGSTSGSQRPISRARRSRYSAMNTHGVRAVPTRATVSSVGIGGSFVINGHSAIIDGFVRLFRQEMEQAVKQEQGPSMNEMTM